jgi:hypothetical protein
MGFLENNKKQIENLCRKYKVKTLHSFGSVNTSNFNTNSDIDLLVDFDTRDPLEYSDNYFNLKFDLENILKIKIDLLESKSIKNQFLKENIDKSKILIYG